MIRWSLLLVAMLTVVSGCGKSAPIATAEHGRQLLQKGDYDQAIGVLSEAIRIEPHDTAAYLYRGRAYQCRDGTGDLDSAIADFTTAIELEPKDHEAYYSRSIAYRDRAGATQSEDDSAKSAADHDMARKLDPSVAETYRTMPEFTTPVEPSAVPAPAVETVTETKPLKRETPADARRRIEAAAAAAAEQDDAPSAGEGVFDLSTPRRYSTNSAKRARDSAKQPGGDNEDAAGSASRSSIAERYSRSRSSASNRTPIDPLSSVPPTLDPLSPNRAAPLTPFGGGASAAHRGGTLPPVAGSPYVAPTPYGLPRSSQSLTPDPLQGAGTAYESVSPYRTPYQSPYVRSGPAPTGIVPSQTLPPATTAPQRRPYVTPIPGRINFPATTRGGQYNP